MNERSSVSVAASTRVLWLPADPAEGSVSMDRHWRDLDRQRRERPTSGFQINCPFAAGPPLASQRAGRFTRAWRKYVAYPLTAHWQVRGADIVHVLDHSFAHLLRRVPASVIKIATVHDLAPLRDPRGLTPSQIKRFRETVENLLLADLLLADSRHTAQDATELLGCRPETVQVLPLGVDVHLFARPQPRPEWWPIDQQRPVVVSVGSTVARKNLDLLPAIFGKMPASALPVLVRVGQKLSATLGDEIRGVLGPHGLIERGMADDTELAAIYQHAAALIFPSTLEGFGLPLLEAMAAGCPVVSSNASSLQEVGGDAALYFAPDDPAMAALHLSTLFSDEASRAARVVSGRCQAASLSWEEHWRKLCAIYLEAQYVSL